MGDELVGDQGVEAVGGDGDEGVGLEEELAAGVAKILTPERAEQRPVKTRPPIM